MPPYTTLPRPEGHIYFSYSPMSPPNWGIVPFDIHVFVYPNVHVALQALLQAATTIQAQRLERGSAELLTGYLFFRGHSEVTQRLLPTRLRGPWREPATRERFSVGAPPKVEFHGIEFPSAAFDSGGEDPRNHWGDWFERVEPMREIEDSMTELEEDELHRRDALEHAAIERASQVPDVASLEPFQKQAAVRHYSRVPSPLLDVSTHPEVAAFFATGGASQPPKPGTIGMLWAIDLNFLLNIFLLKTASIPGGEKTSMTELRNKWGVNKQMFEEYGVQPTRLELASVELPFKRPQAQHARFLALDGENKSPLSLKTELTWWSIIERRAYACAFIQDGHTYENPDHNITAAALWPGTEPLASALSE
jgi:hypothetical protein